MQIKEHHIGKNKIFVEHLIPDKPEDSVEGEGELFEHPVVFIHGAFSGYFIWQRMSSYFAERGFECFALSLRGHNPSGGELEGASLDDYIDDIKSVVDEFNLKEPILIGHSLGGLLAFMYGFRFNDEVEAIIGLDPALPEEIWEDPVDEETINEFGEIVTLEDVGAPTEYSDGKEALPDVPPEYLLELENRSGNESGNAWKEMLRGISIPKDGFGNIPVLVMGVELDHALPFSVPAKKVKKMGDEYNADFFAVKGTTHTGIAIGKNYDKVADTMITWLRDMTGEDFDNFIQDD